jgi:hypothetical protein
VRLPEALQCVARERGAAREQKINAGAQAIEIGARGGRLPGPELGRRELRGADP